MNAVRPERRIKVCILQPLLFYYIPQMRLQREGSVMMFRLNVPTRRGVVLNGVLFRLQEERKADTVNRIFASLR